MTQDTQPNNGGPAFPCHTNPLPGKLANAPQGMTLRDYFAAAALTGMLAQPLESECAYVASLCAKASYEYADAMLAARDGKGEA
jgi:hypothetical protein